MKPAIIQSFLIGLILILSLLLRTIHLSDNPPGFFCDEAAIGYNAYLLLNTSKDEYQIQTPMFFRSFGDYRLPIPVYSNIPSVAFLGLNEFAVRFTAAMFGVIGVFFIFLIGRAVAGGWVGLIAGFLLAISPWHIHMSRWGLECIYFPTVFSIGLYFLYRGIKRPTFLPLAFFLLAASMYTYYAALIVTPLFSVFVVAYLLVRKTYRKLVPFVLISVLVFIVGCLPLYSAFKNGTLLTRWGSVNNQTMSTSDRVHQAAQTYINNFSLDFLFVKGDMSYPGHFITRHSVKEMGELYLFQLPFLLMGIVSMVIKRSFYSFTMLWLLLLFPLGSAITNDGPLATRSIIGLIPLTFLSAVGMYKSISFLVKKKIHTIIKFLVIFITVIIVLFSFIRYADEFFNKYPLYSADFWGWQYGPKEILAYFKTQKSAYDEMYMTGSFNAPDIFLKFYDPERECPNCLLGGLDRYDKTKKQLFAIRMEEMPADGTQFNIKKTIYYPNGLPAFYIVEVTATPPFER